ncbi:AAA family ATPase [Vibrio mangrovi]|uniref:AAA family ATPase n=1 Tax=Vibrio mangrovi TaxID=474394 RepID=A0A1Y6J0Z1_9VIBR|nr:AAA family ATPase [Vibrio mangrovi]MDW6002507.1 AAA family ATPase [Vibrio mangrovi]SMS01963.1 HD domain protein [Vibrio mangrovi]
MSKLQSWLNGLTKDATPDFEECLDWLGVFFPLLSRLSETPQDSQWHGEGNVAIHTEMVLQSLYRLLQSQAQHIDGEKRQALILGAVFHDIAKPLTTRTKVINGQERIVSPGHEERGAGYLAPRLPKLGLNYPVAHQILGLVGYHQRPKLLVVRNADYAAYLSLALDVDPELMYWMEMADMLGRSCDDQDKQLDLLAQFRLFNETYDLWQTEVSPVQSIWQSVQTHQSEQAQVYLNGYAVSLLARGEITQPEEAIAKTYAHCGSYSNLYVMCGISGSGKSTWIKKNLPDCQVISLDDIREEINGRRASQKNLGQILQLARNRLKSALAKRQDVVWDATNLRYDFRKIIGDFGRSYGALITLVVFHIEEKTFRKNDRNRRHTVGDEILNGQMESLQYPSFTEGHRMLIIGERGETLAQYGCFID